MNKLNIRTEQVQKCEDVDGEFWVHWPESDTTDLHVTRAYDRIHGLALGECGKVSLEVWGALVTLEQVEGVLCPDCLAEIGKIG